MVLCGYAGSAPYGAIAAAPHVEQAASAERFVDSIGLNLHLSYHDGPYGKFPTVVSLLHGLGVRHLRDGVAMGQQDVCREARTLNNDGMRFAFITQANLSAQQLNEWASCVGPSIEAYEGLNEYDISHPQSDANWTATVQNAQKSLYRSVKADPALARLTVIGPSLTSGSAYQSVGDLSTSMDDGNMHNYFAGHEPGTGGWGMGGYGSIAYNLSAARKVAGDKPIMATETGYATTPSEKSVDEPTQAAYIPRMFLEQFDAGVPRTYEYELFDEGGPPFGTYGLVMGDMKPKPSYYALSSLVHLLDDHGTSKSSALAYTLDDPTQHVHHSLFVKHDGRFYLAMWVEEASFDPTAVRPLSVAPASVTVRVDRPLRHATLYQYDAAQHLVPSALPAQGAFHLTVSNRVCVLELDPANTSS